MRKAVFMGAAVAAVLLPVGAWAWATRSGGVGEAPKSPREVSSATEQPAASSSVTPPVVEMTESAVSATAAMSAEAPRARSGKSARPARKRAVETVSGAQKIQLEPPPYGR